MQCTNCGFENMPGRETCVQCGAPVTSRTEIAFEPPRAGRFEKMFGCGRLFRLFRPPREHSILSDLHNRMTAFGQQSMRTSVSLIQMGRDFCTPFSNWEMDSHWRLLLRWLWIGSLVFCLLDYGTIFSVFLFFLLPCYHLAALLFRYYPRIKSKEVTIWHIQMFPFFVIIFYILPLYFATTLVPIRSFREVPSADRLHRGDVVIYNRFWTANSLKPGKLVLYRRNEIRYATGDHLVFSLQAGIHSDRIIAGPGQTVTWQDGHLLIDNTEAGNIPKNLLPSFPNHSKTLAENEYYILPLLRPESQKLRPVDYVEVALALGVISENDILAASLYAHRNIFYYFQP